MMKTNPYWKFGNSSTTDIWVPPAVARAMGGKTRWYHWAIVIDEQKTKFVRKDFLDGAHVYTKEQKKSTKEN
jgi:hypothetical protein